MSTTPPDGYLKTAMSKYNSHFPSPAAGRPACLPGVLSGLRSGGTRTGQPKRAPAFLPLVAALAVLLSVCFALPSARAAVRMETNGSVTSVGVPKGENRMAEPESGDEGLSTPPRDRQETTVYPSLPWGIVPEVHIPWPSPPYGGGWQGQRPPYGGDWQGQGRPPRPPQGDWQGQGRPPRPPQGDWQGPGKPPPRPPQGDWQGQGRPPRPPQGGWQPPPRPPQGDRPPYPGGSVKPAPGFPGPDTGAGIKPGTGSPGSGTPPQLLRPPLGSAHFPAGGQGASSILRPPGR